MTDTISLNEARNTKQSHPVLYRKLADIHSEPINWLWKNRIARGKITMLAGDPGLGKSQLTAYMAATVSDGSRWAVDNIPCPQGKVIFLNAEDDAADTIRPRLEAVGANLDQVFVLDAVKHQNEDGMMSQRSFNLKQDLNNLNDLLESLGDVALVIIDPVSAYLGNTDSHKNSDVRALLSPLSDIAAKHKTAVLCVTHLNKGSGKKALDRVTGSGAFVAAARAAYIVVKDEETPERRMILPIKNNIGDDLTGFAFSIQGVKLQNTIETSRIEFESSLITERADEILSSHDTEDSGSALEEAMEFLREDLGHLGLTAKMVEKLARNAGISPRTLRRAKDKLGIRSVKEGREWVWRFPENKEDVQDVRAKEMDTLATLNGQEDIEERLAIQQFDGENNA